MTCLRAVFLSAFVAFGVAYVTSHAAPFDWDGTDCEGRHAVLVAGRVECQVVPSSGSLPTGVIVLVDAGACPSGYTEHAGLGGSRFAMGTTNGVADVGTTGGANTFTPVGTSAPPTFTGASSTVIVNHVHVYASQTATTGSIASYEHGVIDTSSAATEASISTNNPTGGAASYVPAGTVTAPVFTGTATDQRPQWTKVIYCKKV